MKAENFPRPSDQPTTSSGPAGADLSAWVWSTERASSILTNNRSSDVDKLKALESLSMAGVKQFLIPDRDGKNRTYSIEREQFGRHQFMVHLYAQDDQGNNRIVLRGVSNEDGTYRQQRGNDGKYADYEGSWWSKNMGQRSPFAGTNPPPGEVAPPTNRRVSPPADLHPPVLKPPAQAEVPPEPRAKPVPPARTEAETHPDRSVPPVTGSPMHRPIDRNRFFAVQPDQFGCGPTALAMARADFITGRPPGEREIRHFEDVTGTTANGLYPGGADAMAADARRYAGLNARAYNYGPNQGRHAMDLLDGELAQGHGAVVWMENRNTGHGHWGYVAGRDKTGRYVLGDPGGTRTGIYREHLAPVSREHLESLLAFRTGFAAVWKDVG